MAAVKPWPTTVPICPERNAVRGAPQENRLAFVPARGPAVTRRGSTVSVDRFSVPMSAWTRAQFAVFEDWFREDLEQGALSFGWPHPMSGAAREYRFAVGEAPYEFAQAPVGFVRVRFDLVGISLVPWWAGYVPEGTGRVPYAVADYQNGVYGIEGEIATPAEIALVAGTFDVHTTDTGDVTTVELNHAVVAGDIPASQPGGVNRIVAYVV